METAIRSAGIAMTVFDPSANWKLNARLEVQIVSLFSSAFMPHSLARFKAASGESPSSIFGDGGCAPLVSANAPGCGAARSRKMEKSFALRTMIASGVPTSIAGHCEGVVKARKLFELTEER